MADFFHSRKTQILLIAVLWFMTLSTTFLASAQSHQAGDIITDETGIEMVYVPGGTFTLGIDAEQLRLLCEQRGEPHPDKCVGYIQADTGATYQQTVEIQPFWIDRFEMTIDQFKVFCGGDANTDVDNCLPEQDDKTLIQNGNQPQGDVSWYTADYICKIRNARLPTEAEWEYAASGPNHSVFSWGGIDTFDISLVQSSDTRYTKTYPVGSIPNNKSWVGAFDMTGNVAEWVEDRFGTRTLSHTDPQNWPAPMPINSLEVFRTIKGGAWGDPTWYLTNFYRQYGSQEHSSWNTGFRCARTLIAK